MKTIVLSAVALSLLCGTASAATPPDYDAPHYIRGSNDRDAWEAWFSSLSGPARDGADYYATWRNKPNQIMPCWFMANGNDEWLIGCMEAEKRLITIDSMRNGSAQYWNGWNKKTEVTFKPGIPRRSAPDNPVVHPLRDAPLEDTPKAHTAYCVKYVHSHTTNSTFEAFYEPGNQNFQMLGQPVGMFHFRKCMTDLGHTMVDR